MKKFFNTTGPCDPQRHHMLPPQERLPGLHTLVEQGHYFVIHAARQSGKTTLLMDLARELDRQGQFHVVRCNLESLQGVTEPEKGIPEIVRNLRDDMLRNPALQGTGFAEGPDFANFTNVLKAELCQLCRKLTKPLVLFFDEADCLSNGTLITFLRQLRKGFLDRSEVPFVHSVALVGMRNIRDYKVHVRGEDERLGSASPFNIVKQSQTLRNFTREEVGALYWQHTQATGQKFVKEAVEQAFALTQGQPWLVNSLAAEVIENLLKGDSTTPVTAELIERAAQAIILRRDTHIDSLLERLKEDRVRRVIEPIVIGKAGGIDHLSDDYQYVKDLGLIRDDRGVAEPANPICGEIIVRLLAMNSQQRLNESAVGRPLPEYIQPDGVLDMNKLLGDFQAFWRENSAVWMEWVEYKEAAPHLVLMAFLQRVLNGGGQIMREMAAGRQRLDLCVEWKGKRYVIELKIRYGEKTEEEGLDQLSQYMDTLAVSEGWLLLFDRRPEIPWGQKILKKTVKRGSRIVHIFGC